MFELWLQAVKPVRTKEKSKRIEKEFKGAKRVGSCTIRFFMSFMILSDKRQVKIQKWHLFYC